MTTALDDAERRALRQKTRTAICNALGALGGEARREVVLARALADGGFSSRELAAPPPESAGEKYARLVDHDLSWGLTNLKREGLIENPKWGTWRLTDVALQPSEAAADESVTAGRLAELRALPYRLYLRTPEWKRTRAAALLRAGNACSLDVTHTDGLEVHHRTYERLGAELASDLVVLCHACHQLHHNEYGRPRRKHPAKPPDRTAVNGSVVTAASQPGEQRKRSLLRRLLAS